MNSKPVWQSKTFWVGAVTVGLSVVAALAGNDYIKEYPQVVAVLGVASGALTILFRYLSTTTLKLSS